jgi:hypothetical protein
MSLQGHTLKSKERVRFDPTRMDLVRLDLSQTRTGSVSWTRTDQFRV